MIEALQEALNELTACLSHDLDAGMLLRALERRGYTVCGKTVETVPGEQKQQPDQ